MAVNMDFGHVLPRSLKFVIEEPNTNATTEMYTIRLVSINPIFTNGWVIQGSVFNNDSICLIFHNVDFNTTVVRYFDDEVKAHQYMTDLVYGERRYVSKKSKL